MNAKYNYLNTCIKYLVISIYVFRFVSHFIDITMIAKSHTTRYILIKFQNTSYNARNKFVKDVHECSNTFASLCIYIYLTQYNIFNP